MVVGNNGDISTITGIYNKDFNEILPFSKPTRQCVITMFNEQDIYEWTVFQCNVKVPNGISNDV